MVNTVYAVKFYVPAERAWLWLGNNGYNYPLEEWHCRKLYKTLAEAEERTRLLAKSRIVTVRRRKS